MISALCSSLITIIVSSIPISVDARSLQSYWKWSINSFINICTIWLSFKNLSFILFIYVSCDFVPLFRLLESLSFASGVTLSISDDDTCWLTTMLQLISPLISLFYVKEKLTAKQSKLRKVLKDKKQHVKAEKKL